MNVESADLLIRRVTKLTASAAMGGSTKLTIQFPLSLASRKIVLVGFAVQRVAGTAANHAGRIFETSSASSDTIDQKWRSNPFAVGTMLTPASVQSGPVAFGRLVVKLDADARMYFAPNPDAGVDNTYIWTFDYYALPVAPADTTVA